MTELFNKKVTIYNYVPADAVNEQRFDRYVLDNCNIQSGYVERPDGTIQNIVNALTVITKDVSQYKTPTEYAQLPTNVKDKYYTVQVDDFVVLDEVDDVVSDWNEFEELQGKYKDNGLLVTAVNPYIYGTAIDNITITNT